MSISVDDISASLRSATSGGTDKTATVVTASDIESAKSKLSEKKIDGLKEQLIVIIRRFGNGYNGKLR
ncbi:hypothetical protein KOY48_04250 [Candidatus Minimicrobia naudis]|uniref:Uncharacterized protein n=1 Tax=Candidatus Minimicrobia naudis TaxID=2841263 RepID=A0A8F1MC43_9BACT|nr:hypothetical protein KOY48_04250 [Candidatus Minimicrobia naudis]